MIHVYMLDERARTHTHTLTHAHTCTVISIDMRMAMRCLFLRVTSWTPRYGVSLLINSLSLSLSPAPPPISPYTSHCDVNQHMS